MPPDPGQTPQDSGADLVEWRKRLRYGSGAVVRNVLSRIDAWVEDSPNDKVRADRLKTAVDLGNYALRENTSTDKDRWRGDVSAWKNDYAAERGRGTAPDRRGAAGRTPTGTASGGRQREDPAEAVARDRPAVGRGRSGGGDAPPSSPGAGAPPETPSDPGGGPLGARAIPAGYKVWKVGRTIYLVYRDPIKGIPLGWAVEDGQELEAIFGADVPPLDRTFGSSAEAQKAGLVHAGRSLQLRSIPNDRHPGDALKDSWKDQVAVQPWLKNPEVLALVWEANLEGREPTQAEMANTEWWRTHSQGEREALALRYGDPAEFQQRTRSRQLQVRRMMKEAGLMSVPGEIMSFLAGKWMSGDWSQEQVQFQIGVIANPASGNLSRQLAPLVERAEKGRHFGRSVDDTDPMRQKVERWLGPLFARGYSEEWLRDWSRRIADEPAWEERFNDAMRGQFRALFPEYADIDADLTYEDVAGPWRSLVQQRWGTGTVDETDPFFMELVRLGAGDDGATKVSQRLLQEGLKRGNGTVHQEFLSKAMASQGQGIRRPVG